MITITELLFWIIIFFITYTPLIFILGMVCEKVKGVLKMKTLLVSKQEIDALTKAQVDEWLALRGFNHDNVITVIENRGQYLYTQYPTPKPIVKDEINENMFRRKGERRKTNCLCSYDSIKNDNPCPYCKGTGIKHD